MLGIAVVPRERWAMEIIEWSSKVGEMPTLTTVDRAILIVQDDTGTNRHFYLQHDQCFGVGIHGLTNYI